MKPSDQAKQEKAAVWFTDVTIGTDETFLDSPAGHHVTVEEQACFAIGFGGDYGSTRADWDASRLKIDSSHRYKRRAGAWAGNKLFYGCTAYSNFQLNSGGNFIVMFPDTELADGSVNAGNASWPFCTGNVSAGPASLFLGDAVSWLAGTGGSFQNAWNDHVNIVQSTSGSTVSGLFAASGGCNGEWTHNHVWGHSFFAGVPGSGKLATLVGINSSNALILGNINSPGTFTYEINSEGGFSSRWMSHVDMGFCGLTYMGGQFKGGGEHLRVAASSTSTGTFWKLVLNKASGAGILGRATCMAYDQRG